MKFFKIIEYWIIGIVFVWKNRLFNLAFVNLNELKMNWTRLKNLSHDHSRSWTKNQQKYEPDSWTELNWTEMIADLVHFFPSLQILWNNWIKLLCDVWRLPGVKMILNTKKSRLFEFLKLILCKNWSNNIIHHKYLSSVFPYFAKYFYYIQLSIYFPMLL